MRLGYYVTALVCKGHEISPVVGYDDVTVASMRSRHLRNALDELVDPFACIRIIDTLPALLDRLGVQNIQELIGGAHG